MAKRMFSVGLGLGGVMLLCSVLCSVTVLAGNGPKYDQNETCMECHDEEIGHLRTTIHLPALDVSCQDCHVDFEAHLDDDEQPIGIPVGAQSVTVCGSCHDGQLHASSARDDVHQRADVFCNDCHQAHDKSGAQPLLIAKQQTLCLSCHSDQRSAFSKPFSHRMDQGGMSCSSCHDPHGSDAHAFDAGFAGDGPCMSCHTEKRGPFVFEHVTGVAGDCMSCHEHHGSSNPRQLKRTNVDQLCRECHSAMPFTTFGSGPPSFHNLNSARYRDCTVCHPAIHGSSRSPALLK